MFITIINTKGNVCDLNTDYIISFFESTKGTIIVCVGKNIYLTDEPITNLYNVEGFTKFKTMRGRLGSINPSYLISKITRVDFDTLVCMDSNVYNVEKE